MFASYNSKIDWYCECSSVFIEPNHYAISVSR